MSKHTKGNTHRISEEGPDSSRLLQGTPSGFSWLRSAGVSLAGFSTKQFAIAPLAVHSDVKDKYCGTTYFKCMRQICVNKPFSFPRLVFLFAAPLVTRLSSVPLLCHFYAAIFSTASLCLHGEFDIYRKLKRVPVPLFYHLLSFRNPCVKTPYSSTCPSPHCPQQASPISKVKPLPVSSRATMVLTCLSLYATLPASGADITTVPTGPWLCHSLPVSH